MISSQRSLSLNSLTCDNHQADERCRLQTLSHVMPASAGTQTRCRHRKPGLEVWTLTVSLIMKATALLVVQGREGTLLSDLMTPPELRSRRWQ